MNLAELYGKYGTFAILVVIFTLSSIFTRGFATQANLTNVLRQITVVTILALGATFIIILGHINVAYGSMIALIGVISTAIMVATGNVFVAVMGAVGLGLVIGAINGYVITKFHIPAFIMTLAVTTVARGSVLLFTNGVPVTGMGKSYTFIGQGYIGIMPVSVLILLVLFVLSWVMLNKTRFGRHVYAVGGNEQAAIASGIKSKNVVRKAFLFDGFTAAIAGVVLMSRMNSGQPAAGVAYEFDAITAVVVGGTSLAGGSGTVVGTIIGAVIVGIINNVQNLANVNTYWQQIVKGLIILTAVIIDKMTKQASSMKK
ncbi:ABC transporter permease [Clostridiales bacterium F-3ap]|uniref:ABC transporter permease n=2 Tax=Anaerotalea alkaliphila TaxID=2662126 RepID=A0A7X5HVI9_9FIRM|nr:ABC transporter permease [Anaerotalea alkaliphila]